MAHTRRITLCREGWYYLLVLAFVLGGAILREVNLLMLLAGMLIGPVLVGVVLVLIGLRRLEVRRTLPEGVCAGDRLVVDISLRNPRRWLSSWAIMVEDCIERVSGDTASDRATVEVLFPHVPARQTCYTSYQGRLAARGRYRFGPLRLSTRFPMGLVRYTQTINVTDTMTVCPRLGRLTRQWARLQQEDELGSQRLERRQGTSEADFYGLRDWRSGDSRRWIHWRTSARRGGLVVRQFEQRRNQDLAVFVDLWCPERPTPEELEHVELAVSFAFTILADACRRGGSQLFVALGGKEPLRKQGAASSLFLREIVEALATVEPHDDELIPTALLEARAGLRANARSLWISTRNVDLANSAARSEATGGNRRPMRSINVADPQLSEYFQV